MHAWIQMKLLILDSQVALMPLVSHISIILGHLDSRSYCPGCNLVCSSGHVQKKICSGSLCYVAIPFCSGTCGNPILLREVFLPFLPNNWVVRALAQEVGDPSFRSPFPTPARVGWNLYLLFPGTISLIRSAKPSALHPSYWHGPTGSQ